MRVVNLEMMAHPLNWLTLAVWLLFIVWASISLHIIPHPAASGKYANASNKG